MKQATFEKLTREYFNAHKEELKEMYVEGYLRDDSCFLAELIDVETEELNTLPQGEIKARVLEHFDYWDDRVFDYVKEKVFEEYEGE